jgi:PRTRC genetic system protein C
MSSIVDPQPASKRVFIYDGREFPDPGPQFTPDEVREQLAQFFPDLINADVTSETKDGVQRVAFKKRIGTKGGDGPSPAGAAAADGHREVLAALRRVPEAKLRLLELARAALDEQGRPKRQVDTDGGAFHLARAEAQAYARRTEHARAALRALPAR